MKMLGFRGYDLHKTFKFQCMEAARILVQFAVLFSVWCPVPLIKLGGIVLGLVIVTRPMVVQG